MAASRLSRAITDRLLELGLLDVDYEDMDGFLAETATAIETVVREFRGTNQPALVTAAREAQALNEN